MSKFILLFIHTVFLSLSLVGQRSAHFGASKFAPADGKKLLILGQDLGAVGGLISHSDGYVNNVTGHFPAGITSYTDIPNLGGLQSQANWGSGDVNASAYSNSSNFDNSFIVLGIYMVDRLNGIVGGFMDSGIRNLALWVKAQEKPIFLRLGYEFEGPWNGYDPDLFKEAWRHIVHIFDEEDVRNAAFVWQSAGLNYNNIEDWYPGDAYVNWMGFSRFEGFNPGQSIIDFAKEKNKPVMIAEATPRVDLKVGNGQVYWNNWYQKVFDKIYQEDIIKAFAYINVNWDVQPLWNGQGWGDSRVQVNDIVLENWQNEIAKEPWCTASDTLFEHMQLDLWLNTSSVENITNSHSIEIFTKGDKLVVNETTGKPLHYVSIYHINGSLLTRVRDDNPYLELDMQIIPHHGIYIIEVSSPDGVFSKKIVH